jgi:hypothetical protein
MKRFLLFATLMVILLTILLLASAAYMAEKSIFLPGSFFYPLQGMAEELQSALYQDPSSLYQYRLKIAFRRLDGLAALTGTLDEKNALDGFLLALDQVTLAYSNLTTEDTLFLEAARAGLIALLDRADPLMRNLAIVQMDFPDQFAEVETKLHVMRLLIANPDLVPADLSQISLLSTPEATPMQAEGAAPAATIAPQMVQFLPGSKGALHSFFPLTGKHAELICESCHTTGVYKGTDRRCSACHSDVIPAMHFPGDCALCHTSTTWQEIIFNHNAASATNCQSCHANDKPADHYSGQCSGCHNTSAWKPASFNHAVAGATDCLACHSTKRPANHYSGQCSACHSTTAWKPATFNHDAAGATDCQACHADVRPANHYSGQCSACHSTRGWLPANFNHAAANATDCQSCHGNARPANHYSGQCSACHNTNAWKPADFNHQFAGATDCQSCHGNARPANHYSGQCSACHNTDAWKPASFNHAAAGAVNCVSCHAPPGGHYSTQCSSCHNTSAWRPASFNHAAVGATDCQACHARPTNHFQGQCSNCHSTSGWTPANFNHNFPMNHGDANNNCENCHPGNTSGWTCYTCHNQSEMEKHHAEKGITDIGQRCLECHPTGDKD